VVGGGGVVVVAVVVVVVVGKIDWSSLWGGSSRSFRVSKSQVFDYLD
jgi:hypothetical protein